MSAIVSTAGRGNPKRFPGVYCASLLPGDLACEAASVVVSNGGSPTTYQGLAEGKPVVGLPTNMDQFLNMGAVHDAGCGVLLRSGSANPRTIERALRVVRADERMREGARQVSTKIAAHDTISLFEGLVERAVRR